MTRNRFLILLVALVGAGALMLVRPVVASDSGPFTYQWRKGGTDIPGAMAASYTIASAAAADAGSYDVVVTNSAGNTTSSAATLSVNLPVPTVALLSPTRNVLTAGQGLTLGVTGGAAGSVTYQWTHNGSPVAGASSSSLNLANATRLDGGYYVVLVTNSSGTTRSAPIFVSVTPAVSRVRSWGDSSLSAYSGPIGAGDFIALHAQFDDAFAIKADGTVVGWGYTNSRYPMPAGLSGVVAVAVGGHHQLALRSDGTVIAWGQGDEGQLAVPAGLTNVVAIAASGYESLALKSDGTVVAWGSPFSGITTLPAGLANVTAIACGGGHVLALKSDGTVVAWGYNFDGESSVPADLSGVVAVAAGDAHSLALKADGTVVAWGRNRKNATTVPGGLANVVSIAAGGEHSLALKADGTVVAWGSDIYAENSVPTDLGPVHAIAGGAYISFALDDASTSLTAPTITVQPVNQRVEMETSQTATISMQAAGSTLSYRWQFLYSDAYGDQWVYLSGGAQTPVLTITGLGVSNSGARYRCVVSNNAGSVATDTVTVTVVPPLSPAITSQPADQTTPPGQNTAFTVSVTGTGLAYQWYKDGARLSDGGSIAGATSATLAIANPQVGNEGRYYVVVTNAGGSATSKAASLAVNNWPLVTNLSPDRNNPITGQSLVLGVTASGTGPLSYQWTHNGLPIPGAVGSTLSLSNLAYRDSGYYMVLVTDANGTTRSKPRFVTVAPIAAQVVSWGNDDHGESTLPAGLADVVAVSAGNEFSLALKSNGTVVAWGSNGSGQCSVPASLGGVVAVSAGSFHALALKADGTVVAWGYNGNKQCNVPAWLGDVVAISAGGGQSLALKSNGTVVAWGNFYPGQSSGPETFTNIVGLAAGSSHNIAVQAGGAVLAWGQNFYGQTTVPAGLSNNAVAVDADELSLVLKADGTVGAWREYGYGTSRVPLGLTGVAAVAAGFFHSLALKADGTLVGWGTGVAATIPPGLQQVLAVAAGHDHAIALQDTAWGALPQIVAPPANQTVTAGQTATFGVTATGAALSYQWRKDGVNLSDRIGVSGATGAMLTISGVPADAAGSYDVVVSNSAGSVTSSAGVLTVTRVAQVINFAALADRGYANTPFSLTAIADSGLPVAFSVIAGPATTSGSILMLTGTGLVTVRASQAGNGFFAAAPDVERAFTVTANFSSWTQGSFTADELQNHPELTGPNAVYGHDGLSNLLKYALGLEPKQDVKIGLPDVRMTATDWVYTYTRPIDTTDVTYEVEMSTNLTTWTTAGVTHEFVTTGAGTETWCGRIPLSSAGNIYFRLRITLP